MDDDNKKDNPLKLLQIKRKGSKATLIISTLNESLLVTEESLYQHKLVEGIILTPSQLDILENESQTLKCENEATRLLALREHSIREISFKLKRKKFTREIIEKIIEELKSLGHLDDFRLANNYAEILIKRKPCWRAYICSYLQKKYFDRDLSERVVDMVLSDIDEDEQAELALEKKMHQYVKFELESAHRKAYNYLARRGFGYNAAKNAVEKLMNTENEVEEN